MEKEIHRFLSYFLKIECGQFVFLPGANIF